MIKRTGKLATFDNNKTDHGCNDLISFRQKVGNQILEVCMIGY